jgi:hypothetical protein
LGFRVTVEAGGALLKGSIRGGQVSILPGRLGVSAAWHYEKGRKEDPKGYTIVSPEVYNSSLKLMGSVLLGQEQEVLISAGPSLNSGVRAGSLVKKRSGTYSNFPFGGRTSYREATYEAKPYRNLLGFCSQVEFTVVRTPSPFISSLSAGFYTHFYPENISVGCLLKLGIGNF